MHVCGYLFRSGAQHSSHSLLDVAGDTNPFSKAVARGTSLLSQLSSDYWLAISRDSWSLDIMQCLLNVMIRLLGHMEWRLCRELKHYPWILAVIVALHVPESVRREVASQLMRLNPCCLDVFTLSFREYILEFTVIGFDPVEALLDTTHDLHKYLASVFASCKLTSILSEDRFGRVLFHEHNKST